MYLSLEPSAPLEEEPHREQCYRCFRPGTHCYCALLPRIANRTPVLIVQHPRERLHPFGTARMLSLGLERARIVVDYGGVLRESGSLSFSPGAALLYPGPGARNLEGLAENDRPRELVVIDGTWHHARTLYRDIPDLHRLPRVQLSPAHPSRYRIRKEPSAECLSSLEATVESLKLLEPETSSLDRLITAFERIIDHQIGSQPKQRILRQRKQRRPKAQRPLPKALLERPERLVVVYGESIPSFEGTRAPLHWVARRLGMEASFERLISPPVSTPSDTLARHLKHMKLAASDFAAAVSLDQFHKDWRAFIDKGDVLVAYNQSTLALLGSKGLEGARVAVLKSAYGNLGRHRGGLDEVVASERLHTKNLPFSGRAAERLANAIALVDLIRAGAIQRVTE
jgi:DTW domain-containing protein YfiP